MSVHIDFVIPVTKKVLVFFLASDEGRVVLSRSW
mgnify:CR=1 FL=1